MTPCTGSRSHLPLLAPHHEVILLRDCTTAMEAAHTQARLDQTPNAILMLEMFGRYSLDSSELRHALAVSGARR